MLKSDKEKIRLIKLVDVLYLILYGRTMGQYISYS
jgi:hypothetical protein